jgi:hypothetical protein
MSKTLKIALVIIGGIVLSALIFGGGVIVANANWVTSGINHVNMTLAPARRAGVGWTSGSNNPGYGNNMMGGYQSGVTSNVKPLTVDQAKQAVEGYLKGLNNPDLEIKEIMIFDNNAYARITEKSTGIGAMELLVDPASLSVFPEYGPNMMRNLKYGHMIETGGMMGSAASGMMGGAGGTTLAPAPRAGVGGNSTKGRRSGMMGGYNNKPGSASATMAVTSVQAAQIAQQYLDQQFPSDQAATDPDPFYGYYTIDILKDGKPTGMLSVNGFSGQVFLHTWHGTFIEVSE